MWKILGLNLLGVSVGMAIAMVWHAHELLKQPRTTEQYLKTHVHPNVQLTFVVTLREVTVSSHPTSPQTEIQVHLDHSVLRELEFQFPLSNHQDLEQAIASELGVPLHLVQISEASPP